MSKNKVLDEKEKYFLVELDGYQITNYDTDDLDTLLKEMEEDQDLVDSIDRGDAMLIKGRKIDIKVFKRLVSAEE